MGLVIVFGFVGYKLSDPIFDAAAGTICESHAANLGLVLVRADGRLAGRLAFRNFPVYSCTFTDTSGSIIFVDEQDNLLEPSWEYRGFRAAGWLTVIVTLAAGVGLSSFFGLLDFDGRGAS